MSTRKSVQERKYRLIEFDMILYYNYGIKLRTESKLIFLFTNCINLIFLTVIMDPLTKAYVHRTHV